MISKTFPITMAVPRYYIKTLFYIKNKWYSGTLGLALSKTGFFQKLRRGTMWHHVAPCGPFDEKTPKKGTTYHIGPPLFTKLSL